jgi:uncharacterized phiE125 gp8 family phage protein
MATYSKVTVQPTSEPIDLNTAKAHLRITWDYDDAYIATNIIPAARQRCEIYSGLSFFTQTRALKLDKFPADGSAVELPYGPVQSISSISYVDGDGATQTWSSSEYVVDSSSDLARVQPGSAYDYPSTDERLNAVTITYVCGNTLANIPAIIKQAVLLECSNLYENRGESSDLSTAAKALLDQVKVYWYAGQTG